MLELLDERPRYGHLYAALATDTRFEVDDAGGDWEYSERYSAWIVEQTIRHHERDFAEFEQIDETPEEFYAKNGENADDTTDADERDGSDVDPPTESEESDGSEDLEPASSGAAD